MLTACRTDALSVRSLDELGVTSAAASSSTPPVCTAAAVAAATAAAATATAMVAAAAAGMPAASSYQYPKNSDHADDASTAASGVGLEDRMSDFAESDNEQEVDQLNQTAIWASCQDAPAASSKKRWADMAESDEEEQHTLTNVQHHEPRKLTWADLADSDEEDTLALTASAPSSASIPEESFPKQTGKEQVKPKRRRGKKAASPAETEPAIGSVGYPSQQVGGSQSRHNSKWSQSWETSGADWWHSEASKNWWSSSKQWGTKSSAKGERKAAGGGKPQCQFFIGIEEGPKFKVTRKVLGSHGKFMKAIAESTGAKLRLRGRGSGFLEGVEQLESTDELMLCLSATDLSGYREAVKQVRELLEGVYKEYRTFCNKSGWAVPELEVRMHEGPRPGSR